MYRLKVSAIIPVKRFSKAKSRLNISSDKKQQLCKIMLKEVLSTLHVSTAVDEIIVISQDETAISLAKQFGAVTIPDVLESGVNEAISLSDSYLIDHKFDASITLPQDIPFIKTQDIDFILKFLRYPTCCIVVPSRKFDGTNALFRMPTDIIETHYDEDSYKIHLNTAKTKTPNSILVFNRRIMMDIDTDDDLTHCISQNEKPSICKEISDLL